MSEHAAHGDVNEADVVRDAATRSLGARGVRIYQARVREAEGGWTEPWSWEIGVAEPARRAIRRRHVIAEGSPIDRLAEAAARRWSRPGDEPPQADRPRDCMETIEIGRTCFSGWAERWANWSDQTTHGPARALWALEAILGVRRASEAGTREVRGEQCGRYLCEVVPGDVASASVTELIDVPGPDDDWRALTAEVCVDGGGFVRRIAWSPTTGRRLRLGLLPRLLTSLAGDESSDHDAASQARLWHVTELWDYGCQADITAPTNLIDEDLPSLRDIARDLWRMRRGAGRSVS